MADVTPDPRPAARVRDPELLRALHLRWRSCALCGEPMASLHHVHRHPRDDVEANLMPMCGDGTTGCHGDVEHRRPGAMRALQLYLTIRRPDFFTYLAGKLGTAIAAEQWIRDLTRSKLDT